MCEVPKKSHTSPRGNAVGALPSLLQELQAPEAPRSGRGTHTNPGRESPPSTSPLCRKLGEQGAVPQGKPACQAVLSPFFGSCIPN